MRLIRCVVLAGLAAAGCKKESAGGGSGGMGGDPIAAASTDPLWAFAPAKPTVAIVVADGVLEPVYGGALKALAALDKAPGGAELAGMIRQGARTPIGDVLDRATLDALGIDLGKGMAFFESEGGKLAVLPVGDAAKFAGKLGAPIDKGVVVLGPMTCKEISGRFLCGDSATALDAAAKGGGASLVASWPKELRGHIELFVAPGRLDVDIPLGEPGGLRASAILERGAVTARVHVIGKPAGPLEAARSGKSSLAAGVADQQPTGIFLVNAPMLWKLAQKEAASAPAKPLPGGVSSADLVTAANGEAIGYALPGMPLRGIAKIGLASAEPVKKLVAACAEFAAMVPPGIAIKKTGEKCTVSIDPAALGAPVPGMTTVSFDLWVESSALVIGAGQYTAKSDARPGLAPFAREILDGSWLFAAWGRGATAGAPIMVDKDQLLAQLKAEPTVGLVVWGFYHLNEFGVAGRVADDGIHGLLRVRTLWANPDEVVAAVEEKVAAFAGGDLGALVALGDVAKKFPGSPFARDIEAGVGGLMAPVALAGVIAAVSVPAFVKYKKKSETTEARINVMKMYSGAREHWLDSAVTASAQSGGPSFPAPSAGPTPPLGTCCKQGGTCQPSMALWAGEPWKSLKFSVDDPHQYSYEYKVETGKPGATDGSNNFTVYAYGDLDCDGLYSTFSVHGVVDAEHLDGPIFQPPIDRENETE